MTTLLQDVRYAARGLFKSPGFTAVAVAALALGVGANTAIFSVVNAVLLRPLPYEKPERLMLLRYALPSYDPTPSPATEWFAWREQARSFESLAAYGLFGGGVNLTGPGGPERINVTEVTADFFKTVGVAPARGRTFLPEEEAPGRNHVAVISYGLWRRSFGADDGVVGRVVRLNDKPFTVVGVAPPGLQYPAGADAWLPVAQGADRVADTSVIYYEVLGRLREGATRGQAAAEMAAFSERLRQQSPGSQSTARPVEVVPLAEHLVKDVRPALLVLLGAVLFVLLIACVNVANLLLARSAARRRELAVRAALGASRWRLARQLLAESLVLSLLGGGAGLLLAMWGTASLPALGAGAAPRLEGAGLDARVLGFTLLVSLLTGLLFGLLPALQGSRVNLNESLKEGGFPAAAGRGLRRSRSLLVVAETALALVLMIGAGLLMNSFVRLRAVDPGFDPEGTLTAAVSLPTAKYDSEAKRADFFRRLLERLRSLPGVRAAGVTNALPLSDASFFALRFDVEGRPPGDFEGSFANFLVASPDYFKSMGIRLVEGRPFDARDEKGAAPVVIVNEVLARRHWPGESAVGQRLVLPLDEQPREVIGVVAAVRGGGPASDAQQEMYLPYQQSGLAPRMLALRAGADPAALAGAVRAEVKALDPDLPLYDVRTMKGRLGDAVAKQRFTLVLFGTFAAAALLLTAVGVFGVVSYTATQRTREIGIRVALGARPGDALRLVVGQGMAPALAGVGLGLAGALALARVMSGLLYGVSPTDPLTFALVSVLLALVALAACYLPARRAAKVDPMVALRYE